MWTGVPAINGGFPVKSVSCTSFSFCVAVGNWSYGGADAIVFDGNSWSTAQELDPTSELQSVSCASTTYCIAVGSAGAYLYNGQLWSQLSPIANLDGTLTAVSCTSDTFCVAMGNLQGSPDSSTAYVLNGTEWAGSTLLSSSALDMAVSCQSTTWCMAVGTGAELWDGATWTNVSPPLPASDSLNVVSCPDGSDCIAIDANGTGWSYDGSEWKFGTAFAGYTSTSISCVSATSCLAADTRGNIASYDGTEWTPGPTPLDPISGTEGGPYLALSCTDPTFCAAVDDGGNVWYDNFGTWTTSAREVIDNAPMYLSCVSSTFCMAVDTDGSYLTYDGSAWSTPAPTVPYEIYLNSVSCVSPTFCVAADYAGYTLVYNGVNWTPSGWMGNNLSGRVACVSTSFCVEVAGTEAAIFNGTTWGAPAAISSKSLSSVSCSTAQFCAAFDQAGNAYTFDGSEWTEDPSVVDLGDGGLNAVPSISCPSDGFCVAVDTLGDGITLEGGVWTVDSNVDTVHGYNEGLDAVSCALPTYCVGVGSLGSSVIFSGIGWSAGQTVGSQDTNTVSCPSANYCVSAETDGVVHVLYVDATSVTGSTNVSASTLGQPITFTAGVTATGTGLVGAPDRNVTFAVGSTVLCTATVVAAAATCEAADAPAGDDQVVVSYSGDIHFGGSQTTVPLEVTGSPAVTSPATANFVVGHAGTFTVKTSGYPIPSVSSTGALPSGVTFVYNNNGTATLSGTPMVGESGKYPITITADNGIGAHATQTFTLTVNAAPTITSPSEATFTKGLSSIFTVAATGTPVPTFAETGSLDGLILNPVTGDLSGTPTSGGSFAITVTATNGIGSPAAQKLTLLVNQAPAITSASTATLIKGVAANVTVTATAYPKPYFTETGSLDGLTLNHTMGVLSGTPTTMGTFPITMIASNGIGTPARQKFELKVLGFDIITRTLPAGKRGTYYSTTLTAAGGTKPFKWRRLNSLPAGLSINSAGVISGTPNKTLSAGPYTFKVQVFDSSKPTEQVAAAAVSIKLS
jgi:hypothetical protein